MVPAIVLGMIAGSLNDRYKKSNLALLYVGLANANALVLTITIFTTGIGLLSVLLLTLENKRTYIKKCFLLCSFWPMLILLGFGRIRVGGPVRH